MRSRSAVIPRSRYSWPVTARMAILEEGNMETGYEYLKGLGNVVFQPETAGLLSAALLYESDGISGERIQAEKTEPVSGTAHAKDRKIADHPEQNDSENTKQWTIRIDPADFPGRKWYLPGSCRRSEGAAADLRADVKGKHA